MSKSVRAVTVAVISAVLAIAASGCGGDVKESNAYVDAVNTAQTDFARTFDKLQTRITAQSSAKQDAETLAQFEAAIDDVVGTLQGVKTPEKVKTLHQQLVSAIKGYGQTIAQARKAFRSKDPTVVLKARTQLSTDVATTSSKINQTIDAINRKLRE